MKIRRYTCKDMQEAMQKVKKDLGSEAVILSSKKVKAKGFFGLFKKPLIEVIAAVDDNRVSSKVSHSKRKRSSYTPPQPQPQPQYQYVPVMQVPVATTQMADSYNQNQNQNLSNEEIYLNGQARVLAQSVSAQTAKAQKPLPNAEDPKIYELESKVKDMEIMLGKVYKAFSGQKGQESEEAVHSAAEKADPKHNENLVSLRNTLFERDVEPRLIEKIIEKVRDRGGNSMKKDDILSLTSRIITLLLGEPEPIQLTEEKRPHVAIFIGPTGVGKTTTLAKIAAEFTFRQKKVGLITADTYRISAVEQLKTYAEILNLKISVVYSPDEIEMAVQELSDNDLILIDTAGRSHKNKAHFDELKALMSVVNADEIFLVINCNTSRIALREILEYYGFIKDYKLLFTKLDESPVCGIILNARYMTGKPLSYTTNGQSVPDDMSIANVNQIIADILNERGN